MSGAADPAVATDLDRRFMAAAIRLGRRHLGRTGPNPSVGAICVVDGPDGPIVVGRGVTAYGGRPHAEPQALTQAGDRARGSTLYVTLEPCSHWGKSPPCADAIVAAGVARVVVARDDPDPRVAGRGYARLAEAGIGVVRGVLAAEAWEGLSGFLARVSGCRPEVLLKLAISADGMIGRHGVANFPITGPAARARAQLMRMEADAIAVGIGTAALDDPELTVRLPGLAATSPRRIVFDRAARLSPASRLVASAATVPVSMVTALDAPAEAVAALAAQGVSMLPVPVDGGGRLALAPALGRLEGEGINTLMVEGGAELAESFLVAGLVDRLALFRSPVVVGQGGIAAPPSLAGVLAPAAGRFHRTSVERWGDDLLEIWQALPRRST
mgnify:CR=1 FL=1